MSENAYGFSHALTLGNVPNYAGLEENRKIRQSNLNNITKYQNNVKNAVDTLNTNNLADKGFKKVQEVIGDQLLTKGAAVDDTLKALQKTAGAFKTGGGMLLNKVERVVPVVESEAVVGTSEAARLARAGAGIGEVVAPVAKDVLGGAKILGGALQIGQAGLDIYDDAEGGFKKMNEAQKAGNIGEIAAGGAETLALGVTALETAGLALDSTVFGAPAGVLLNIAGGILGLVAAGADIVGDKEENEKLKEAKTIAKNTPITSQAQVPIVSKALGTTGAEVKNNIQEGR
tara:strand:+ start:41 stop:904 length:864 start_codon:yes stop_codon:yes gene_type:complete